MINENKITDMEQMDSSGYKKTESGTIYTPIDVIYTKPIEDKNHPLTDEVTNIYNDRLKEVFENNSEEVSTENDITNLNNTLDDEAVQEKIEENNITVLDLAERGVPSSDIMRWYKAEQERKYPYGAGLYNKMKDKNVDAQLSEHPVMYSEYLDTETEDALLHDALQNVSVNLQALNDMEAKATAYNNERGIVKRMAVGVSALIPFDQERVTLMNYSDIVRKYLGEYKEVKELSKLKNWNANDIYTAARASLHRVATKSPTEFKQVINDIDEELLSQNITFGDRATFWQQVNDTTYALNRFAFGADIVGAGFVGRAAGKAAKITKLLSGSTTKATASAGIAAINEIVPVTSAAKSLHKMNNIGYNLLTGQHKKAVQAVENLAKLNELNKVTDSMAYAEKLKSNAEPFLRNTVYDAFSPNSIKMTSKAETTKVDAIADAAYGIEELEDMKRAVGLAELSDGGLIKDLSNTAKRDAVTDFKYNLQQISAIPQNNTNSFNMISKDGAFTLQTKIGGGPNADKPFTSVKEAEDYAKKFNKLDGEYKNFKTVNTADVVIDNDGIWVGIERQFTDGDKTANLGDLVTSALKESKLAKGTSKEFSSGVFSGLGGANLSADYTTRVLNNLKQADEGRMLSALKNDFKNVKKGSGPVLNALMEQTAINGRHFTVQELKAANIPDKVIDAYRSIKVIEDAQYLTTSKAVYEGMLEEGVKNVTFRGQRLGLGKQVAKPSDRVYITVLNGLDDRGDDIVPILNKTKAEMLDPKEYTFVKMTEPLSDGADNIVAIRNYSLSMKDPDVMNTVFSYKPGRMQFSPDTGFIKQVSTGKAIKLVNGKEKEETVVNGIRTLFAHPDRFKVKDATETLEGFRQLAIKVANGSMSMEQAQLAIKNIKGYEKVGDFESFYGLVQDGFINLDPKATFQYVRDGEQLMFDGLPVKDFNYKGASATQYSNSFKVWNKKKRSDSKILNPFNFGDAPRLNAQEEMSLATGKILKYSTIDEYSKLYAQDFKTAFGKYLDSNRSDLNNLLWFSTKENRSRIPEDVIKRIENAQTNYKRMMGTPTEGDMFIESVVGKLVDKLFPDIKNMSSSRLELYRSLSSGSPIRAAKAMTFHWYLGMWNPRQFWMQAAASFNALTLSPKAGAWSAKAHLPVVYYINQGDATIASKLAKNFDDVSKRELIEVAKIAKKLDVYSQSSHAGAFERTISSQVKKNRFAIDPSFFYLTGEYLNRTYTATVAAREAFLSGMRAETMTAADIANLVVRQQNLYMNMGRAGTAEWQRGFASFLTQFKGYQFRYLESMLDETLTLGEKSRLLMGQAIFGGTKGFIGPKWGARIYNASVSDDRNTHPLADLGYHGLADWISLNIGSNVSYNDMFDLGLEQIADIALEGSFLSMPPAYSAISKASSAVTSVFESMWRYYHAPLQEREFTSYLSVLAEDVSQSRGLPSGFNNELIGYLMFKSGKERMTNGGLSREGVTAFESAMKALGFQTLTSDKAMIAKQELDKLNNDESHFRDVAMRLRNNMLNAATDMERDIRAAELRGFMSTLHDEDPYIADKLQKEIWNMKSMYGAKTEQIQNLWKRMIGTSIHDRAKKEFENAYQDAQQRTEQMQ